MRTALTHAPLPTLGKGVTTATGTLVPSAPPFTGEGRRGSQFAQSVKHDSCLTTAEKNPGPLSEPPKSGAKPPRTQPGQQILMTFSYEEARISCDSHDALRRLKGVPHRRGAATRQG